MRERICCLSLILIACDGRPVASSQEWVVTLPAAGPIAQSISVDGEGSVYAVGSFRQSLRAGGVRLTTQGGSDLFVVQISAEGEVRWAWTPGEGRHYGVAVTQDERGHVFVVGAQVTVNESTAQPYLARLSSDGDLVWQKVDSLPGLADAVACDATGNIYVTGYHDLAPGFQRLFLTKYSPEGEVLWQRTMGESGFSGGARVKADPAGRVWVAGVLGIRDIPSLDDGVPFVARYSGEGALEAKLDAGKTGSAGALAVAADGTLLVGGWFKQALRLGATTLSATGVMGWLAQLAPDGQVLAARAMSEAIFELAPGAGGLAVLQGPADERAWGPPSSLAWYSASGQPVAETGLGGLAAWSLALDRGDNLHLIGTFKGLGRFGSIERAASGEEEVFVWKRPH